MIDAYDIYQEVCGLVNKEENGYLPADLFNRYGRAANRFVFNDYLTRLQNPQTAAVEKQKLEDRLFPFEIGAVQAATAGIFTVPDDNAYFRSAKIKNDGGASVPMLFALTALLCEADNDPTIDVNDIRRQIAELVAQESFVAVDLKDHDQIAKRLNSYVPGKRPSLNKPIMERITVNGVRGFQVYPTLDLTVFYSYYRRPSNVNLVMKVNPATLALEYDLANSTGFEWTEEAMTDVVARIVNDFATYIREGGLFQMAAAASKP